ncbi:elongation factor G [bacterium]|nr:elongation factor G [bacterium]
MKGVPVQNTRNVILAGHAASGKTTIAEHILFASGMISRLGAVEAKNTVSDCTPEEQDRQISVHTAYLFAANRGHHLFFSDTPGYADFVGEVVSAARVADAGVIVVDAAAGIGPGTMKAWELLDQTGAPRMVIVNKMDREGANAAASIDALVNTFGKQCIPLNAPVGSEASFTGVADLFGDTAAGADEALFTAFKTRLVDAIAESDEKLMEKYLGEETLSRDELVAALRTAITAGTIVPVVFSAAAKGVGIKEIIDTIIEYLPSPADRGEVQAAEGGPLKPDPALPAACFVFKTVTDAFVGQVTYLRVYQGTIAPGADVLNVTRNAKERLGELLIVQGKEQIRADQATPGDIVAVAKLKATHVNDVLGAAHVKFTPIEFPKPVMTLAVASSKKGEEEKIAEGLHRICEEDPTIKVERNEETHQTLVSGMGDVHLDVAFKRMKEKFKVEIVTSMPKVAYHETIRGTADVRYRHKKQSGGAGQFGEVAIKVRPNKRDAGYEFIDNIVGGVISNNFIPSVDKGIQARMKEGIVAGCPVVDIIAELWDGKEHPVDSKDIAFQTAGRYAIQEAVEKAQPILLEPIMDVEITVPPEFMGDINGNLNSKRGHVMGVDVKGSMQVIKAMVPQAEMFRFCSELRSITGGRGSFSMSFHQYQEVPPQIAQQVIAAYQKSKQEQAE